MALCPLGEEAQGSQQSHFIFPFAFSFPNTRLHTCSVMSAFQATEDQLPGLHPQELGRGFGQGYRMGDSTGTCWCCARPPARQPASPPPCSRGLGSRACQRATPSGLGRHPPQLAAGLRGQLQDAAPSGWAPLMLPPTQRGEVSAAADTHHWLWRTSQHLEPIPLTETCPRSKTISENPNGLSLAVHQTAVCEGTRSEWPQ